MRDAFLARHKGREQIPVALRCGRLTEPTEQEVDYVDNMTTWMTQKRPSLTTAGIHFPPSFSPAVWNVPDIADLTARVGEQEMERFCSKLL